MRYTQLAQPLIEAKIKKISSLKEEAYNSLRSECSDYLKAVSQTGQFFYRGVGYQTEYDDVTASFPRILEYAIHLQMIEKGFTATRKSLYATPDIDQAEAYTGMEGDETLFGLLLPNSAKVTYSNDVEDLHLIFDEERVEEILQKLGVPEDINPYHKDYNKVIDQLPKSVWNNILRWANKVIDKYYEKDDFAGAIQSGNEVMIESDILYSFQVKYKNAFMAMANGASYKEFAAEVKKIKDAEKSEKSVLGQKLKSINEKYGGKTTFAIGGNSYTLTSMFHKFDYGKFKKFAKIEGEEFSHEFVFEIEDASGYSFNSIRDFTPPGFRIDFDATNGAYTFVFVDVIDSLKVSRNLSENMLNYDLNRTPQQMMNDLFDNIPWNAATTKQSGIDSKLKTLYNEALQLKAM